jgi:hypothetical protein
MGWSYAHNSLGERIGYSVPAVCFEDGCEAKIHRGLAYTCGGLDGHDNGIPCGGAYCGEHLYYGAPDVHDAVCGKCLEALERGDDE